MVVVDVAGGEHVALEIPTLPGGGGYIDNRALLRQTPQVHMQWCGRGEAQWGAGSVVNCLEAQQTVGRQRVLISIVKRGRRLAERLLDADC